jgi:16S rRNA (cytosine1402-N4)-methyltransferase
MHTPVLLKEVLEILQPKDDETYVDATFGAGGYTQAILESCNCNVIAFDRDETVIPRALEFKEKYGERFHFHNTVFSEIDEILAGEKVDGIIADFGVSSMQLDTEERGFSFQKDAKLDMRMGKEAKFSAFQVVNSFPEPELMQIIQKYGEERLARKIANFIVRERSKAEIKTTLQLASIVKEAYGSEARYTKINPATKTFQAIRIFINNELYEIETLLEKSITSLKSEGRLITVSFHSLEDSIVKEFLNENTDAKKKVNKYAEFSKSEQTEEAKHFKLITKGAVMPSDLEVKANVRSRSAKLRGAMKITSEA